MDAELSIILGDLARHETLFRLDSGGLGKDALDIAVNGVKDHFDAQVDPDGRPWPVLSSDYKRWKDRHFPGNPIGKLTGLMRSELDGEPSVERDSAEWTACKTEQGRQEATWFQEGDPEQNRPERRFADLNAESTSKSDQLFDRHFEEGTN